MFRAPVRLLVVLLVPVLAGCSSVNREGDSAAVPEPPASMPVGPDAVVVKFPAYNPKEVPTTVGHTVTWTFDDNGLGHTVTADDGSFDSGRMSSGEFKRAFDAPGRIGYHCNVHARMKGTVVVGS
jgi:plastocyanin